MREREEGVRKEALTTNAQCDTASSQQLSVIIRLKSMINLLSTYYTRAIKEIIHFFRDFQDIISFHAFIQSSFSLFLCTITGVIAGTVLGSMSEILSLMPGLLILIPSANDMRGNVYGAMASRLGTAMHLGIFSPSIGENSVLRQNIQAGFTITLSFSVVLGVIAKLFADILGMQSISVWSFVFISVFGGILSGIFLLGITVAISIFAYKRKWDIDNFSSPLITSIGDMTTIPSLYLAALILLMLDSKAEELLTVAFSLFSAVSAFLLTYKGLKGERMVRRIILESVPVLFICGILSILTGLLLESHLEHLISAPEVLVLIPPFLGVSGALGGILSARISSMLHIGMIEPRFVPERRSLANFAVTYALSPLFILVGTLSWLVSSIGGGISGGIGGSIGGSISGSIGSSPITLGNMILISVIAGVLCASFINIATYYIASISFKRGFDPDNDTIPLITSLTDIFGVICTLTAMNIVL